MSDVFSTILKMSLVASIAALIVLVVRLCLRRAPKIYSYVLWIAVLCRLVCPFAIEIEIPVKDLNSSNVITNIQTEPISPEIVNDTIYSTEGINNHNLQELISEAQSGTESLDAAAENNVRSISFFDILSVLWILGVISVFGYTAWSYFSIHQHVKSAIRLRGNIYESDRINSAFVLGIISPRVYIPSDLSYDSKKSVINHELTHIRRGDYIVKVIAFFALALHWFNPIVWLSYWLMSVDMEQSCDESVIKAMAQNSSVREARSKYANALLSVSERVGLSVAVYFSEISLKKRMANILTFKECSKAKTILLALGCVLVSLACLISCELVPEQTSENEISVNTQPINQNSNDTFDMIYQIPSLDPNKTVQELDGRDTEPISDYIHNHQLEIENGLLAYKDELIYCGISENHHMTELIIPEGTTIINYAQNYEKITQLTIPNTVTYIYGGAFSGCTSLVEINIGTGLRVIKNNTFADCTSLEEIVIPHGIVSIEGEAFCGCTSLKKVTIPESVVYISSIAFSNNHEDMVIFCEYGSYAHQYALYYGLKYELLNGEINSSESHIANKESSETTDELDTESCKYIKYIEENSDKINNGILKFEDELIYCGMSVNHYSRELLIPEGTTMIYYARNLPYVTHIIIPDSVTYIFEGAFESNWGMNEVKLSESIKVIERRTFYNCTGLYEITIPYGVVRIEDEAFAANPNLTTISIPSSVTYISESAFESSTNYLTIHCEYGCYAHQYALMNNINVDTFE